MRKTICCECRTRYVDTPLRCPVCGSYRFLVLHLYVGPKGLVRVGAKTRIVEAEEH